MFLKEKVFLKKKSYVIVLSLFLQLSLASENCFLVFEDKKTPITNLKEFAEAMGEIPLKLTLDQINLLYLYLDLYFPEHFYTKEMVSEVLENFLELSNKYLRLESKRIFFRSQKVSSPLLKEDYILRLLSPLESSFRSCLKRVCPQIHIFFPEGLELNPNYYFFTITHPNDLTSSGLMTVVLGTSVKGNKSIKTAFLKEIEGIPDNELIIILSALRESLKEKDYTLAIPLEIGEILFYKRGLYYLNKKNLPEIKERVLLKYFYPRSLPYPVIKDSSSVYNLLDSLEFTLDSPQGTEISAVKKDKIYSLRDFDIAQLIENALKFLEEEALMEFIDSVVSFRDLRSKLFSSKEVEKYLKKMLLSKRVKKSVRLKYKIFYLLITEFKITFTDFVSIFESFKESERFDIVKEISTWKGKGNNEGEFYKILGIAFKLGLNRAEDLKGLFKQESQKLSAEDFLSIVKRDDIGLFHFFPRDISNLTTFKDEKERTVFHHVSKNGNLDMLDRLIAFHKLNFEDREPINTKDIFEKFPLHYASEYGYLEIVRRLLTDKVFLLASYLDKEGMTPRDYAISKGHIKVANELKKSIK
ncbi:MAG: ankyrin repeat domain-containing protein [Bdellovibrionales bacterium]|nr:ankyrin repeat domain-containing protein [Bdellovibrionales bacterium]